MSDRQVPRHEHETPERPLPGPPPNPDSLPFPPTPSGSTAARTIQESTYSPQPKPNYLPADAPNILIVLIDDAGPAMPSTFGGEIDTPTMSKIVREGIAYNRFHTTAMCSPTRASLLTGRNHHVCAAGQISELANDWDGYAGTIPKSCALIPDVLRMYGYSTAAWGKWHNTPPDETSAAGPFDNWPARLGFEYFYGFLSGEASQYEPNLVRGLSYLEEPPHSDNYHLSEDLAEDAMRWLRQHRACRPDKPFFMYWASGAIHGPHHVATEWADKYKGKFDDGWDAYRARVFERAKALGWIADDAELTPRHETMPGWDSIPEAERPFQLRLMEVLAGFAEHTDHQVGKIVDEIDRLGFGDNTLIFYIWGDNGASAEGQNGTIAELIAQNGLPTTVDQHIKALDEIGGLAELGGPKTDNMYHAGWAWAGVTPYKGTKLLASHFGGTRNPLAVRWPVGIKPDQTWRPQFHHCNDIVPTIYEILGITPPHTVNGIEQDPFNGVSMAYSFADAAAPGRLQTQYFEIMGSRAIYHEGWLACALGPRLPWLPGKPDIEEWNPDDDVWELYHVDIDWSQAHDLAAEQPEKVAEMKALFLAEAERNKAFPIGGGLFVPILHPELKIVPPYSEWEFDGDLRRMPEGVAPMLGTRSNIVTIDAEFPEAASGVLYELGGFAGGVTLYCDGGDLCYEYNLFIIRRDKIRSRVKVRPGRHQISVETKQLLEEKPAGSLAVTLKVDGTPVGAGLVPVSCPAFFTANECLDIGIALGSPVSDEYYDRVPFPFTGTIERVHVDYIDADERRLIARPLFSLD